MSLTIGRAGAVVTLDDPDSVTVSGDTIRLEGDTPAGSAAAMQALRDALCGLTGVDEPVVPMTWTEDASLDGFVAVDDAAADYYPVTLATGSVRWSATLRRMPRVCAFEVRGIGAVLSNTHTVVTGDYTAGIVSDGIAIPGTATLVSQTLGTAASVTTATGTVTRHPLDSGTLGDALWASYVVAPADYYLGGCLVEAQRSSTWYPVTGRDLPSDLAGTAVRISNGIVRVGWTATRLQVAAWDGSQWDAAKDYLVGHSSGGTITAWSAVNRVAILRNGPEQVVVRLWVTTGGYSSALDLTVTRGHSTVRGTWARSLVANAVGVGFATPEASTSDTWGLTATSADGDGNKSGIWTPHAVTVDTTNGEIETSTVSLAANGQWIISPRVASTTSTSAKYDALATVALSQRMVVL